MSYSPQLIEPIRVELGKMLIVHEIIKLFPDLDKGLIESQVDRKWADFSKIVIIRDFWNLVDSLMMGYKLKDIAKNITSQQYTWRLITDQPIANLRFCTNINGLQINTKSVSEVKTFFEANPVELQRINRDTLTEFPEDDQRHLDPIIVFKEEEALFVHDGNGRLLKAIVEGQSNIRAYIGTRNNEAKSNHWVLTSYLQRLANGKAKELLIQVLSESINAVFEFEDRVDVDGTFKQNVLDEIE
ncbi:MAG: hypothetical protein Q7S74_03885 [Nanoarchaeota archaeon]|nr:hypothetical protein [Nanoarchaeota archaeon]